MEQIDEYSIDIHDNIHGGKLYYRKNEVHLYIVVGNQIAYVTVMDRKE